MIAVSSAYSLKSRETLRSLEKEENPEILTNYQKAEDVWKKDVWDFQAFSQTFFELRLSLGNEAKRRQEPELPDLAWNSPDVGLPDIRDHLKLVRKRLPRFQNARVSTRACLFLKRAFSPI